MDEEKDLLAKGYFVAKLDGRENATDEAFLENIGKAFNFPDYYGMNYNALDECINDLDWLPQENYALIIEHSADLLAATSEANRKQTLQLLNEIVDEWANVPNFEGEDIFRKKADFKLILR